MTNSDIDALCEARARKICEAFKIDPDAVVDDYGPVLQWHLAAYHVNEAILALRDQLAKAEGARRKLLPFTRHHTGCPVSYGATNDQCICGLSEARAYFAAQEPTP